MYIQKFSAAAGSKIAVTGTATNIFDLVNTAQSTTSAYAGFSSRVNAIIIQPEDGAVRYLMDGNTPTATNGFLIPAGQKAILFNVPLQKLMLIRTGSVSVNCSIQIGISDPSESSSFSGGSAGISLESSTVYNGSTPLTPKFAFANVAASQTDANLVTAVTAKKIRVLQMYAMAGGTATNLTFNSKPAGAGTAISALLANGINLGEVFPFSPVGWFETVAGEGLTVTTGAGSTTGIGVVYVEV